MEWGLQSKVLARRVSSRPMDAHFWKKHKENSPNLLYVLEKHAFWTASFQCLVKSLFARFKPHMHSEAKPTTVKSFITEKLYLEALK